MNQNVIAYLQENKDKYSQNALVVQLQKNGYLEQDIEEGISFVYGEARKNGSEIKQPANSWDFKTPKIYTKSSEKWLDFLFGFFAAPLFFAVSFFIPFIGPMAALIFIIFCLFYLFNRRRFTFYGILVAIIMPVIFIIYIVNNMNFY